MLHCMHGFDERVRLGPPSFCLAMLQRGSRAVQVRQGGRHGDLLPTQEGPQAIDEEQTEPGSKRAKDEQPATGANATAPLLLQPLRRALPLAVRSAPRPTRRKTNPHPPAAHHADAGAATEPAWLRSGLLPRHGLPKDLSLHFVGEKFLQKSDVSSRQTRFLIPSNASDRLRALLSAEEIDACGLDGTDRTARSEGLGQDGRKKSANPTRYVGRPVSVYECGGEWEVSELRLNKFHRSDATVINGRGYMQIVGRCGFVAGDRVEIWAFRRPP